GADARRVRTAHSHRAAASAEPRHRRLPPEARGVSAPRRARSRSCRRGRARPGTRPVGTVTLWQGRFGTGPAEELMAYTASLPFDRRLAGDDIAGSRAHVRGLARAGLLDGDEVAAVLGALDTVADELRAGAFVFEPSDEDIHTAIERR